MTLIRYNEAIPNKKIQRKGGKDHIRQGIKTKWPSKIEKEEILNKRGGMHDVMVLRRREVGPTRTGSDKVNSC